MARWDIHFDHRIDVNDRELLSLTVEIESYRLSIMRIPLPPKFQIELDRLNAIRQIQGTTGIEGNQLTEEQIRKVIDSGQANLEDEKEVENAYKVRLFIREIHKQHSETSGYVSEELVKRLHFLNTTGLKSEGNEPGKYRSRNVHAGDYNPPDYTEVPDLMKRFIEVINTRAVVEGLSPLIRAVIAHFYLITIHPFADGNGRTSRALEAYILYSGGYNIRGFYSLANYHYRHRSEYVRHLDQARFIDHGNLTEFVKYCLRAFLEELSNVQGSILDYVKDVMFRDFLLESLRSGDINSRMFAVVEFLLGGGTLYTEEYRNKKHGLIEALYKEVTTKTAQRDLKRLIEQKWIVQRSKQLFANADKMNIFID